MPKSIEIDLSIKLGDLEKIFSWISRAVQNAGLQEATDVAKVKESVKLLSVRKESDVELQQSPGNQSGN